MTSHGSSILSGAATARREIALKQRIRVLGRRKAVAPNPAALERKQKAKAISRDEIALAMSRKVF
jgi:hypothetical protein